MNARFINFGLEFKQNLACCSTLHPDSLRRNSWGRRITGLQFRSKKYSGIKTTADPNETRSLLWLIKTKQNKTKQPQKNKSQTNQQKITRPPGSGSGQPVAACCHGNAHTIIRGLQEHRLWLQGATPRALWSLTQISSLRF